MLAHNYQQVRLDGALKSQNLSNVSVLQEPTLAETPVSPNPRFNLAVGVLLGLLAAALSVVGPRQIEQLRRVPDLSGNAIPRDRAAAGQEARLASMAPEAAATSNGSS